jgi:large subunit ribosomal protein L25
MSETFEFEAKIRKDLGKGASRRLRHSDQIPAIIYGGGGDPVSLTLDHKKANKALESEATYSSILTINIGGKKEKAVLKDVQRHPYKPKLVHLDFLRIKAGEKLHMHVPLHFLGADVAPGAKEGGLVSHLMMDIEVACLPEKLPEYIEIDISKLGMDGVIRLSDVKLPAGVELIHAVENAEQNKTVVSIHQPRVEKESGSEAAGSAEGQAPESGEGESTDKKG